VEKYGVVGQDKDDNIAQAHCTKAADINSEYVILIPFARQQRLIERVVMILSTYTVCLAHFFSARISYLRTTKSL